MFSTIAIAILLLIAVAIFAIRPKVPGERNRQTGEIPTVSVWWVGFLPLIIGLVWALIVCTVSVQAKQVGVVTTFGKPSDQTMSSGLHFKAPWQKVTEIDATIQTDEYHDKSGIQVRLADGNTAKVSATIRWSVSKENADDVYADFRSDDPTESLRDAVVSTQFKAATNAVFAQFDPMSLAGAGEKTPDYTALADDVEKVMLTKTNDLVEVESVTISLLTLDNKSQKKIDEYISEVAKTRVAEQAQKTATEQAKANKILSDSISNDPNVLVARCFDALANGDFKAPAGFSCWNGGGSAVVIPSAK